MERPNRFLVRCKVDNNVINAHLPDPGRLKELLLPNSLLFLEHSQLKNRKTHYTVHLVNTPRGYVSINTRYPNMLVFKSLQHYCLPGFEHYQLVRPEVPIKNHRLDFELLSPAGKQVFMEVKSVTLVEEDGTACFPDAVTDRGRSHVELLSYLASQGLETSVYFVVQRSDASLFTPHWERDPAFSLSLRKATEKGLKIAVYTCLISKESIQWGKHLPYELKDYRYDKK